MRRKSRVISSIMVMLFWFSKKAKYSIQLGDVDIFVFVLWRKRNYGNMAVAILISLYVSHIFLTNKSLRELMGFGLYKKTQHFFFLYMEFC